MIERQDKEIKCPKHGYVYLYYEGEEYRCCAVYCEWTHPGRRKEDKEAGIEINKLKNEFNS